MADNIVVCRFLLPWLVAILRVFIGCIILWPKRIIEHHFFASAKSRVPKIPNSFGKCVVSQLVLNWIWNPNSNRCFVFIAEQIFYLHNSYINQWNRCINKLPNGFLEIIHISRRQKIYISNHTFIHHKWYCHWIDELHVQ